MHLYEKAMLSGCENVYEPMEDSFLLAEAVEKFAFGRVLDLGTGTGIQGIVAAMKGCEVTFSDSESSALKCAKKNAAMNKVGGDFIKSDMFKRISGTFNTIIFNPPYLPSDVASAGRVPYLDGGENGRDLIERFLSGYKRHVAKRHVVLLLESSFNQYEKDIKEYKAEVAGKAHYFFEDIIVLKFR